MHPHRRLPRRRRVQVDRRRADLAQHGPEGHAPHRPRPHPSEESRSGLRRRIGTRFRPERAARGVPLEGRGGDVGARAVQEREGGGRGHLDRPDEPAHPVCDHLGGGAGLLGHTERRPRVRYSQVGRRRRHVGRSDRQPRSAGRSQRTDRRGRLACTAGPRMGAGRGGGRRRVPVRRLRRDLAVHQRRGRRAGPSLVLLAHLRPSPGRGYGMGAGVPGPEVRRRGAHLRGGDHPSRRQSRPVDRSARPPAHDRGQRRRCLRELRRRSHVVHHIQPADGRVLPHRRRQRVPVSCERHPAGQQRDQRSEPLLPRRHTLDRLLPGREFGERPHRRQAGRPERHLLRRGRERARRRRHTAKARQQHRTGPGLSPCGRRATGAGARRT